MHQFFYSIYLWISKHKIWSFAFALVFLLVGVFFASKIQLEDDITRVIPQNEKADITSKVFQQQQFSDKITVIIERQPNASTEDMMQTAEVLVDSLANLDYYISNVQGAANEEFITEAFDFVYQNLPLYLDETDYQLIDQKLNSDSIQSIMQKNYESLISPSGVVTRDFILKDPLGLGFLGLQKLQKIGGLTDLNYQDGYIFTKDETKLLLFIDPKFKSGDTQHNTEFVEKLQHLQHQLNQEFQQTELSFFGAPIIAVANAQQIKTDIMKTVLISMSVLMLLLMLFYRQIFTPIIIFIPTIFGVVSALLVMYFLRDSLSAISLSIGAVLLGITIDYSLHVMTHYKKNESIQTLFQIITRPVLMSCITTAVAFVCLIFVHSEALIDLGIFAFVTVTMSGIFTLIIIPHLYQPQKGALQENQNLVDKIAKINYEDQKGLFWASLALVILSIFTFNKVKFNENLEALNFVPTDQQLAEKKLAESTTMMQKSVYVVNHANDFNQALNASKQLENTLNDQLESHEILDFSSINNLLLAQNEQLEKITAWNQFWTKERKSKLQNLIISEGDQLGFVADTHQAFFDHLKHAFQSIDISDIQGFNPSLLKEFVNEKDGFYTVSTLVKLDENKRNQFVEQFKNAEDIVIIDRKNLSETFLGNLVRDFNSLINYSSIAILIILWIFFRRIELVLVSFIPIALTGFVTAGLMGLFNIEFNIFSSIVYTLVFGHGVDFSIFMTSALQKQYTTGRNELKTYRTSILLAVITTILAIGALIFAEHPALKSISSVALIGVVVAVIITFVFYPPIFKFFFQNRPAKGLSPVSLRLWIQTLALFFYFLFFGMILNVIVFILRIILPISAPKKHQLFDWMLTSFLKTVPFLNPFVKKVFVNPAKRSLQQTVFISNHSSSLDIPLNKMLLPKSIFVVNDWVYNSPIYGKAIRSAGFFPVTKGLEDNIEKLEQHIGNEFSVIIYPEGTRSSSNALGRFHKGAFYLADELNLPIQPVYLLGCTDVWPKNELVIFDGQVTVVFGEVIQPNDEKFGSNYSEKAKKISQHFKTEFQQLRHQYEDENYYKQKLHLSFLYKEPEIVKEMKMRFEADKSIYYRLNNLISVNEKVFRIANDLGELDFILTKQQAKRKILTSILEEEKRAIAASNYITKIRNIHYIETLEIPADYKTLIISYPTEINIPDYIETIFILNDVMKPNDFLGFEISHQDSNIVQLKKR